MFYTFQIFWYKLIVIKKKILVNNKTYVYRVKFKLVNIEQVPERKYLKFVRTNNYPVK